MNVFVSFFSRLDSLLIDINCGQMYTLQKFNTTKRKSLFAEAGVNTFTTSKSTSQAVGLFKAVLRQPHLLSVSFRVPCHHTCHHVSLCTPCLVHSVPVQMIWRKQQQQQQQQQQNRSFICKTEIKILVTGRSLFRLLLSGTTFLLTIALCRFKTPLKILSLYFCVLWATLVPFVSWALKYLYYFVAVVVVCLLLTYSRTGD